MCQRLATLFCRSTEVCTRKNTRPKLTLTLQMKGSLLSRASFLVSTLHSLLQAFANLCTDTGASFASQTVPHFGGPNIARSLATRDYIARTPGPATYPG